MKIVKAARNRQTGTLIQVVDNRDGSFDEGGEPWYTVCDQHGRMLGHRTRRLAEWHAPAPMDWCECCDGREGVVPDPLWCSPRSPFGIGLPG